jgi:hypothetical protein
VIIVFIVFIVFIVSIIEFASRGFPFAVSRHPKEVPLMPKGEGNQGLTLLIGHCDDSSIFPPPTNQQRSTIFRKDLVYLVPGTLGEPGSVDWDTRERTLL